MFFNINKSNKSHRKNANRTARKGQRRLGVEHLEDRTLLTTTWIIMDFTPDSHPGNFVETFNQTTTQGGHLPRWLDFNKDGRLSDTDVQMAADQITGRVQSYFSAAAAGRDVRVRYGDVFTLSNLGTQWINWGRQYADQQVSVMYVGGTNRGGGYLGMAPVAPDGSNVEGYGETYSRALANWMVSQDPRDTGRFTTTDFVNRMAQVAAHELGHMFGLRHNLGNMQNNVMNPSQPNNPAAARFLDRWVNTTNGYQQNAFRELRASFAGQRPCAGNPNPESLQMFFNFRKPHSLSIFS